MDKVYFELRVRGKTDHIVTADDDPVLWAEFIEMIHAACDAIDVKVTEINGEFVVEKESEEE